MAVGLRVCRALARLPLELGLCAGVELGLMRGRGLGVLRPDEGASTYASASIGATATWPLTRALALAMNLDGAWTFDRPRFVIFGVGDVHSPSAAGVAASLGAEASW